MRILLTLLAASIAVPALAQTAPTPAPAPKMECCCKKMGMIDKVKPAKSSDTTGSDAGHDMSKR